MLPNTNATRKPDKTGRIDVTAARLRLNLADPADMQVNEYVKELKEKRECKTAMMRGLEMDYDLRNGNYNAIVDREPELVAWILERYGMRDTLPALAPLDDTPTEYVEFDEDVPLEEPNLDDFAL